MTDKTLHFSKEIAERLYAFGAVDKHNRLHVDAA